jgi:histidine ammonia-lyase/phenylalanine ammonia-lyase
MGTMSARELRRVLDLVETVATIHLLAVAQAVDIRHPENCHPASRALHRAVRAVVPEVHEDRRMDRDIQATLAAYRAGAFDRWLEGDFREEAA